MEIVFLDFATRSLVAQSVNRTGVAEQAGNMMNVVLIDVVVRHGGFALGPAITHRNTGIVCIGHFVIFNHDIARITGGNAHSALVFVRHVRNEVVTERVASADFVFVLRIVRNMDFGRRILRELAEHDAVRTDFVEHVAFDQVIVRAGDHVKAVCRHLRKRAVPNLHVMSVFDAETSIRAPKEELVTAQATVFSNHLDIEHARLQIQEPFFTRAQIV